MPADVRIPRRATFAAGHILCREDWTDEKNREVFGACSTDHGHNYVIEVTVGGVVDQETGMVVNLKHVDNVLRREVVDAVDHHHMNRDVDFIRGVFPTPGNVALAGVRRPGAAMKTPRLLQGRAVAEENNA